MNKKKLDILTFHRQWALYIRTSSLWYLDIRCSFFHMCHDRCSRIFNKLYRKLYVWVKTMLLHHRIWSEPVINLGWGNSLRKEWFIDIHLRKGVLWKRIFFWDVFHDRTDNSKIFHFWSKNELGKDSTCVLSRVWVRVYK